MSSATAATDRQKREASYYDQYAHLHAVREVDFTPVLSDQRRPWSPYWTVCRLVRDAYATGARTLLDAGCGMGAASVCFARLGFDVTGFDISDGNLSVARRLAQQHELSDRCRFLTMPAERLDFPDASFDVVVGIDFLHHVEVGAVLNELARVLRPGGVAIFKEPLADNPLDALRTLMHRRRRVSLQREVHVTEDERKLGRHEIRLINQTFAEPVFFHRFSVLQRAYRLRPDRLRGLYWKLQRADYELMRYCPPLGRLGDVGVFSRRLTPSCSGQAIG